MNFNCISFYLVFVFSWVFGCLLRFSEIYIECFVGFFFYVLNVYDDYEWMGLINYQILKMLVSFALLLSSPLPMLMMFNKTHNVCLKIFSFLFMFNYI